MTDGIERLHRAARWLGARAKRSGAADGRLPPLFLVTDPGRTPRLEEAVARLPPGSGVIFRAFGAADAIETGRRLARLARERGLVLLVGADAGLAWTIEAQGVHLPERLAHRAGALRRAHPAWRVTAAAHGLPAARRALRAGAHAVLISPAFVSNSPSAGAPLGAVRFAAMTRAAGGAVYALGGIDETTAPRLIGSGAVGVAAVEALVRT